MTRADWLLFLLICFGIGALFKVYWSPGQEAATFSVTSPGGSKQYPLDKDAHITVQGPLGLSHIVVENHAVRFSESPCRHKVCVRSGWHRRSGSVAACVPNRISLSLAGVDEEFDGLSY